MHQQLQLGKKILENSLTVGGLQSMLESKQSWGPKSADVEAAGKIPSL